jgi:hypothetical protein
MPAGLLPVNYPEFWGISSFSFSLRTATVPNFQLIAIKQDK